MAIITQDYGSISGGGGVTPDMIGKKIVRACDNQMGNDNIVTSLIGIKKIKITAYTVDYSDISSPLTQCQIIGWKTDGTYDVLDNISTTTVLDVEPYYALAIGRVSVNGYYAIWVVE